MVDNSAIEKEEKSCSQPFSCILERGMAVYVEIRDGIWGQGGS